MLSIASDHGTGSSIFVNVLKQHECVFMISEPFSWDHAFVTSDGHGAVWSRNGSRGEKFDVDNAKLGSYFTRAQRMRGWDATWVVGFHKSLPPVDLRAYFQAVRDMACAASPCAKACTLAFKLFPSYIGDDPTVAEELLRTEPFYHLQRNETARQHSIWRRWRDARSPEEKKVFNYARERPESDWDRQLRTWAAAGHSSRARSVRVEEACWPSLASYTQCATDALALASLNMTSPVAATAAEWFKRLHPGHIESNSGG